MNLLVTGRCGFIGSNFVRWALKAHKDLSITNLDALTYAGNLENLKEVEGNPRHVFVRGSVTDAALVDGLAKGADATLIDRSSQGAAEPLLHW